MEDTEAIKEALEHDANRFEELQKKYWGPVYGYCYSMVRDPRVANELCEETFVRAWEHLAQFQGRSSFKTWLHHIAQRVVLQYVRHCRRKSRPVLFSELRPEEEPGCSDPEHEVRRRLDRALELLEWYEQAAVLWHVRDGLTLSEVAERLGRNPATVGSDIHRALAKLRELLS